MILAMLASLAFGATELPGEELFSAPSAQTIPQATEPAQSTKSIMKRKSRPAESVEINLPTAYLKPLSRESNASELVQPPKGSTEILRLIKVGESIQVHIAHSVIAFPDEKAPVIATSQEPKYRGLKFIGESTLEQNTKRIFITFTRVIAGDQIYQLKAAGLSAEGQPGLTGEHHSREAEYFAGDFISSFVAGYFDGLVPRHTNAFGQIEQETSIDAATKKGLASGALSTAERFREKLKKVPEFSELPGPFSMKLLILDQAKSH